MSRVHRCMQVFGTGIEILIFSLPSLLSNAYICALASPNQLILLSIIIGPENDTKTPEKKSKKNRRSKLNNKFYLLSFLLLIKSIREDEANDKLYIAATINCKLKLDDLEFEDWASK